MRVQSVNLNLIPTGVMPIVHLSQYDRDADGALLFNIFNGPAPFNLTGCTATINGTKPDGNVYTYPCTVHSNFLTSAVYDQMTTVQGTHEAEIRISDGDSVVGTLNFQMAIEKAGVSEIDVSHTDVPALLENIQASVDEAEYWAEQAAGAVAGVASFNGRHGSVLPVAGDYDASQISYGGSTVKEALDNMGGGHTILNASGQEMPQRKNLRFTGANVSDDAEDDTTNVTIQGGAGGSTITVSTIETSLYGETVTITDGTATFTGVFDNTGVCVISGVTATGTLTVTSGAATRQLTVPYYGNYEVALSFWSAEITVTTDPGVNSAIVKKDGVNVGTISFSAGTGTYIAGSTGAYTFTATVGGVEFTSPTVNVTEQTSYSTSITIWSATLNISTGSSALYGKTITIKKGSTTVGTTAFSAVGSASYTVHETGTYTLDCEGYTATQAVSAQTTYNISINTVETYTVTVDIYSAASDTLSYTDDNGAQTVTTDSTGKATGVSITITQPSAGVDPTITFTSTVAKDPTNLSNNYSKSVTVTSGTTEIYVMPDTTIIYWFGWKFASATGGTQNTNSIQVSSSSSSYAYCDFNDSVDITGYTNLAAMGVGTPVGNRNGCASLWASQSHSGTRMASVALMQSELYVRSLAFENTSPSTVYPSLYSEGNGSSITVSAMWLE